MNRTYSGSGFVFDRIGTAKQTLVERVPGIVPFGTVPFSPATEALNSRGISDFTIAANGTALR